MNFNEQSIKNYYFYFVIQHALLIFLMLLGFIYYLHCSPLLLLYLFV
jgi:hypothetical protein